MIRSQRFLDASQRPRPSARQSSPREMRSKQKEILAPQQQARAEMPTFSLLPATFCLGRFSFFYYRIVKERTILCSF